MSFTANATGGKYYHTLTVAEMPKHAHMQYVGEHAGDWGVRTSWTGDKNCQRYDQGLTEYVGNSSKHYNVQPYIGVYIWKRTG